MALIHILDKQNDEIIGTIRHSKAEYWNAVRKDSVNNNDTLDFTANARLEKAALLSKRNRLVVQDEDGFFREYVIVHAEQYKRGEKLIQSNSTHTDLATAKVIEPQTLQGATAATVTDTALLGTEWKPGAIDYAGIRTIVIDEYTDPLSLLRKIAEEFGLEIRYRIEITGNRVTGRFVDMVKQVADFEGTEIEFRKNLIGVRRKEDSMNIVTALLGVGPERPDGTRLTVLVEDAEALQRWGRKGQHLIKPFFPESANADMTLEQLRTLTTNELKKRVDSVVSYECEAASTEHIFGRSHEKIRTGKTVRIKDDGYNPPLYLEARILDREVDPSDKRVLKFTIGNFIEYKKEDLEKQIVLLKKLMAQKANSAKLVEAITLSTQQAQQAENNAKQYADAQDVTVYQDSTLYTDQRANQVDAAAQRYALSEAEKARLGAIQAAAADAQNKVNAAVSELETDIAAKADAQWVNGQLVTKANTADTYTKTEVNNALNSKVSTTTYQTDQQGTVTRFQNAESRITQTENNISSKVSQTTYNTDVGSLQTRMGNAETSITQQANEITLRATKTEVTNGLAGKADNSTVTSLAGRVSTAEGQLTVQAERIQARVTKTEFDGLQIGGRNLLEGSATEAYKKSLDETYNGYNQFIQFDITPVDSKINVGDTITISFDIQMQVGTYLAVYDNNQNINKNFGSTGFTNIGNARIRLSWSLIVQGNGRGSTAHTLDFYNGDNGDKFIIENIKIEKGNKATDWTPAPEDTDAVISGISGRLSSAESTITQQAGQIQSKVSQTEVDNSISNIKLGGANLLKLSGAPVTSNAYQLQDYYLTEAIPDGTELTISLKGSLAADRLYFGIYDSGGEYTPVALFHSDKKNGIYTKSFTWKTNVASPNTLNPGTFIRVYHMTYDKTSISTIEWIKLEKGNKATDWTPAIADTQGQINSLSTRVATAESSITQQAGQIASKVSQTDYNGNIIASLINQTASGVRIEAKHLDFKIGDDGDLEIWLGSEIVGKIDKFGAYFPDFQSNKIRGDVENVMVTGYGQIYIDGTNGDDANSGTSWATAKKNLQNYIDSLPKNLNGNTTQINLRGDILGGIELKGFHNGELLIAGDAANGRPRVFGKNEIVFCTRGRFLLQGLDLHGDPSTSGTHMVLIRNSSMAQLYSVKVYGNNYANHGFFWDYGSRGKMGECHVYSIKDRGLYAADNSHVHVLNCRGSAPIAFLSDSGSIITGTGARWGGSLARWGNAVIGSVNANNVDWQLDPWTIDTGEAAVPAPAPSTETTITVTASSGDNYSSQGFWTNDEIKQGDYGYGDRYGIWYFDLAAIKTRTVVSAQLTFTRASGGASASRTANIRSHAYSSRASRPSSLSSGSYSTSNAVNASIAVGETKTVDVTNLVNLNIAKGGHNSLGVWNTESTDYMSLGTKPTLKIRYK